MYKSYHLRLGIDLTEWALPLEVWWTNRSLCFEVLCFSFELSKGGKGIQVIIDE